MKTLLFTVPLFFIFSNINGQSCTPQGNQTSYGNNNVWRGYVYDNINFTDYKGFVTEGSAGSPNFDQNFGGDNINYSTNGCSVTTTTFSVRYKLTKTFANGSYDFTVGGDDGYRLSLDGGSTWVIDRWFDQGYNTTNYTAQLNGSYNMVLEFYENGGGNRVSINIAAGCSGAENTNVYGTDNVWRGYVYDGINFDLYRGVINRGSLNEPAFDESFGGSNTNFGTTCSSVNTETFSVRFRLTKTFAGGNYTFFVGGDDGYRLSLDGGNTWIINKWVLQSYNVTSHTMALNGTYNMVLEYYENSGENRINFSVSMGIPLPVKLLSFTGTEQNNTALLNWTLAAGSNPDYFEIEKSADGTSFFKAATITVPASLNNQSDMNFSHTDRAVIAGKSFYRLRIVDLTGVVTYSKTVTINIDVKAGDEVKIFPTILTGNNTLTLQTAVSLDHATIVVTNMNGMQISQKVMGRIPAGQSVSFVPAGQSLARGIYFVRIADGNRVVNTKKVIVQ